MEFPGGRPSMAVSVADSTATTATSAVDAQSLFKRKSSFYDTKKRRQSIGAYTSLFTRKLMPPLGFYRETDKYNALKVKYADEPEKLDAVEEMWRDYKKYQIRKRFRWPPNLFFGNKLFWTTGYYGDYQKDHRATKLRKPGEDSSEDEFFDPAYQFQVFLGDDDINMDEFDKYRQAKKLGGGVRRTTRFALEKPSDGEDGSNPDQGYLVDPRPTITRLFEDEAAAEERQRRKTEKAERKEARRKRREQEPTEEVETIVEVEYTLVKDPNKKKKKKKKNRKRDKSNDGSESEVDSVDQDEDEEHIEIAGLSKEDTKALKKAYEESLATGKKEGKVVSRKKEVARTMIDEEGKTLVDVEETEEHSHRDGRVSRKTMMLADDDFIPVRHSLTTLSTIWDTGDENLRRQYSTHTLTVTNLPDKVNIKAMSLLFPGAKVNLKTPKRPGEQPYATVRFRRSEECKARFMEARNIVLEGNKLVVNPKVKATLRPI